MTGLKELGIGLQELATSNANGGSEATLRGSDVNSIPSKTAQQYVTKMHL